MSDVTQILAAVRAGGDAAATRLFELVCAELRQLAAQASQGHQCQPGDGLEMPSVEGGQLAAAMADGSICGLGQAALNPVLSLLRHFPEDAVP